MRYFLSPFRVTDPLRFHSMKQALSPFLFVAVLALTAAGCNIINPSERTPTYVHIDSFSFVNTPALGSASQRIGHVYLYYNNQSLGAYDLPCTVPVLTEAGGGTVQLVPGVDLNGFGDATVPYPFFQGDTIRIDHAPGTITTLKPKTHYNSAARLIWEETFDGGTQFVYYTGEDSLRVTSQPGEVFEGSGSGKIHLSAGGTSSESATPYYVSIPLVASNDSYVEFNYRGTADLQFGMASSSSTGDPYFVGFRPRDQWTKIYVQIRSFVGLYPGSNYNLLLRAVQPEGSTSGGDVFIDNVKVISY